VFVAIPKTGSQAVRACLRPLLAANDWEQCTLLERRVFPVEPLAAIGHGHVEWREVEPYLLGRLDQFTSFAVVRDPYERFASFARFAFRDAGGLPDDYLGRFKALLSDPVRCKHILLREQHRFVCDRSGAVRTTILRYEQLAEDLAALCLELGLSTVELRPVNTSPDAGSFAFDAELRDMVRARYAEDFRLFGYDPQGAL
jgi:Sulfotransferase family